jgi:hypothetical protein
MGELEVSFEFPDKTIGGRHRDEFGVTCRLNSNNDTSTVIPVKTGIQSIVLLIRLTGYPLLRV